MGSLNGVKKGMKKGAKIGMKKAPFFRRAPFPSYVKSGGYLVPLTVRVPSSPGVWAVTRIRTFLANSVLTMKVVPSNTGSLPPVTAVAPVHRASMANLGFFLVSAPRAQGTTNAEADHCSMQISYLLIGGRLWFRWDFQL